MTVSANKTIILKGEGIREEMAAGGTIKPGHLCEINSSGAAIVHNSAGESTYPLFAIENALMGADIDDDYSSGDWCQLEFCHTGMMVLALLANGNNAAIGQLLESAGNGELQNYTPDSEVSSPSGAGTLTVYDRQVVAVARSAVNMASSSPVDPDQRIKVSIV